MEQNVNTNTEAKQRPVFLTVLCILTFIGSGLIILGYILGFFALNFIDSLPSNLMINDRNISEIEFSEIILYLIMGFSSLAGAILMWKLKKIGFWLYTVANILLIIIPCFYNYGSMEILMPIVTIVFISMYGVNLKYMS